MSGTSMDGIDVALIDTDGEKVTQLGPTGYRPYVQTERMLLRKALAAAVNLSDRSARPPIIAEAETLVTAAHAEAVETFLLSNAITPANLAVVGFHGQTLLHRPDRRLTVQIGNGHTLAVRLGVHVVYDFRAADVLAGGQGAPLAPLYHRALVRRLGYPTPVAVLNIGGVANLTYIDGDEVIACDTGPGNALIDDFLRTRTGRALDADGSAAAAGVVDKDVLDHLLTHPFFAVPPPKSLDRNDFRTWIGRTLDGRSLADGAATLTALTVAAVARIVQHLPHAPATWIFAGGGAHNLTLMRSLQARLAQARIVSANEAGWTIDALEAQAFAYLAVRSLRRLPISLPTTTGVPHPFTGGVLARP